MTPLAQALATYTLGVLRARGAYYAEQSGLTRCGKGHLRATGQPCRECGADKARRWRGGGS